MPPPVTGVILAGGRSRRFGSDKAVAMLSGERFVDREAAVLSRVCDEVVIVGGDPARFAHLGLTHLPDERPGLGPLGGLATALAASRHEHVLLLACDMPLVTEDLLRALLARAAEADVVVPASAGRIEPLCAVYARACLPAIREALARGDRHMRAFHGAVRVLRIPVDSLPDSGGLANVNTPADLAALQEQQRLLLAGAEARRLAALCASLPAEPMRRGALADALRALDPATAAAVLHALLQPDAPRQGATRVAAASCAALLAGGEGLPYELLAGVYEAASARGYEEVRRLLLQPGARREAAEGEVRPDPRVAARTLGERRSMARRNDPDLLDRLLFDPDPGVLSNLLVNPRLTERDAIRIASHRPGLPEVLRALSQNPRFGPRERVRRALVRNPYTPADVAANLIPFLTDRDLREVAADAGLHASTREAAATVLAERRKGRR